MHDNRFGVELLRQLQRMLDQPQMRPVTPTGDALAERRMRHQHRQVVAFAQRLQILRVARAVAVITHNLDAIKPGLRGQLEALGGIQQVK